MLDKPEFEKIFFLYTLKEPKYLNKIENGFYDSNEIEILSYIARKFYEEYKEIPSKDQLKIICKQKYKDKVKDNIIDAIFDIDIGQYDENWLKKTAESWILWRNLDKSVTDTLEYIKTVNVNPDNVEDVVNKVKTLIVERNNVTFDDDLGSSFYDEEKHQKKDEDIIVSPLRFFNDLCDGYTTKSLITYMGEPNIGKSLWLANDAADFVRRGYDVSIISAEMGEQKFVKRIGSNLLNIKMDEYDKKSKDKKHMRKKIQEFKGGIQPPGELYVKEVPTAQFSALDIENYLKDLEDKKGIKLKIVVIDYINILNNFRNPNTEDTYNNIKQISQDLRAMAIRNNWLIITATQLNRSGFEASDIAMDNISESVGLTYTADTIFGIIQDPLMYQESKYWLKIVKNRDGKGKNLKNEFGVDYNYMRLIEKDRQN